MSLIKLLEHVKFGEATATSHSVVKEQLIISDTYYSLGYSSNYHTFLIFRKWPQSKRWSWKKLPKLLPVHQMSEVSLLNTKGKQKLSWLNFEISVTSVWILPNNDVWVWRRQCKKKAWKSKKILKLKNLKITKAGMSRRARKNRKNRKARKAQKIRKARKALKAWKAWKAWKARKARKAWKAKKIIPKEWNYSKRIKLFQKIKIVPEY